MPKQKLDLVFLRLITLVITWISTSSTSPGPKFPRSLPLLRNQRALLAPQDNFPSGSVATYGLAMYRKDRASGWKGPLGLTSKSMDKQ